MLGLLNEECLRLEGRALSVHFWGGLFQEKTVSALKRTGFLT